MKTVPLTAAAGLVISGLVAVAFVPPKAPLRGPLAIVMQSTDGSTRTCPAADFHYDNDTVTIVGLACPVDAIFKNGFEP